MTYYREGDNKVICARSGFPCKRSECRKEWDGKLVLKRFWKPRHPQDLPAKVPKPSVPMDVRSPVYNFVSTNEVTAEDL